MKSRYPVVSEVLAEKKGAFYVFDWAGNEIEGPFEDFEDGWGWVREKFPDEEDWQEFEVREK